jgi:uncharacterized membrane protein YraQ (UPF0718 family)
MLIIAKMIGKKKMLVYVGLVVMLTAFAGLLYGMIA